MPQDLISVVAHPTVDYCRSPLSFLTDRTLILFGEVSRPACPKFLANSAAGGSHVLSSGQRDLHGGLSVSGSFPSPDTGASPSFPSHPSSASCLDCGAEVGHVLRLEEERLVGAGDIGGIPEPPHQPWPACPWTCCSVRKRNPHLAKSHDTQVSATCSQGHSLTDSPGEIPPNSPKPGFSSVPSTYQPEGPQDFGTRQG